MIIVNSYSNTAHYIEVLDTCLSYGCKLYKCPSPTFVCKIIPLGISRLADLCYVDFRFRKYITVKTLGFMDIVRII